jgi:hypothetical protein
MRCLERKTTERRWDLPLQDFLERCSLVQRLAANQNMTGEELLVDGMIANRLENETYEAWLARQVREELSLQCEQDNWRSCEDGRITVRSGRELEQMPFTAADRRWLTETLGSRADVRALRARVCQQQPLALAA